MFDISGKNIVITGGAGILGADLARGYAQAGARIMVLDLAEERARNLATSLGSKHGYAKLDVLNRKSVEDAAAACVQTLGSIDVLINAAGGNHPKATTSDELSFFDVPPESLDFVFKLNLNGSIIPAQVFGKIMADQGQGNILNISSMSAFKPLTRVPAYSAAKAAISNFTQWLAVHMAQEYAEHIRVNAIAPGFFLTDQNRFLLTEEGSGELTERGRQIIAHTPQGRFGDPEDLIGTAIWLISDAARFVTGVVVPIDGGYSAFGGV